MYVDLTVGEMHCCFLWEKIKNHVPVQVATTVVPVKGYACYLFINDQAFFLLLLKLDCFFRHISSIKVVSTLLITYYTYYFKHE